MLTGLATAGLVGMLTVAAGAPAAAEPSPTAEPGAAGPPIGPATPGNPVCTVSNPELDEITGMVATANGIYAVEGGATSRPFVVEIWTINPTTCEATSETYGFAPLDPQDLSLGPDGALWVADIGPGLSGRDWVTMERVDLASGADAVPYRTLNPATGEISGTPAVLLDANNSPIIIANVGDAAALYVPSGPLPADTTEGLPTLQQVGQFRPVNTDTPTVRAPFGRLVVTGAATSPDRTKVVLRTESDAYEFAVPDGDIVRAITEGTPTITPLPDEDGQAITYSADGTRFLTLSAGSNPVLRSYVPYVPTPESPDGPPAGEEGRGGGLSFGDITTIALITGFLGLAAVVVGVVGIVRFRRQQPMARSEARARGRSDDRRRERVGAGRDRRGSSRWDEDEAPYDDGYNDEYGAGPGRAPKPRGSAQGSGGGYESGGPEYGSGGYDSGGPEYGYDSGGPAYGSGGGGGQVYGSGGGGTTYGAGGTTYGSGGRSSGSSGRSSVPGGRGSSAGGGGVYGRPRADPDDEARHPYGRDNIDL